MPEEILTGGRITMGVVRRGDRVHRPQNANSAFVHAVLEHLEKKSVPVAPRFYGVDAMGREVLTYIPGHCPDDLGDYSAASLAQAASLIRSLHEALRDFPGCGAGQSVLHGDLSPCNFIFDEDLPIAVIDWDAAHIGDPLDDLAYAAWMWLDLGNDEGDVTDLRTRLCALLDAYGVEAPARRGFEARIAGEMERVAQSIFPTAAQTRATSSWARGCMRWLAAHPLIEAR